MPQYFLIILVFSCLIFHTLFGRSRKRKLAQIDLLEEEKQIINNFVDLNIKFSIICITLCLFISLYYTFFPELNSLLIPLDILNTKALNYFGIFLVKISFITSVVLGFQISDKFSFELADLSKEKIKKIELMILFTEILLCAGIFIFISNVISFALFVSSICFYIYCKLRF